MFDPAVLLVLFTLLPLITIFIFPGHVQDLLSKNNMAGEPVSYIYVKLDGFSFFVTIS